jgi:riboflavin kinase/FMN adenylyltransferase
VVRLRDMERFPNTEALVEQMHRDVARTREVLDGRRPADGRTG